MNNREIGVLGEQIACEYLSKNSYNIIEKNYRFKKYGEIDVIADNDGCVCFIEIKSRTSTLFGLPCEAVTLKKQQKIKSLAQIFIKQHNLYASTFRFDVVEVFLTRNTFSLKEINLIKNAF